MTGGTAQSFGSKDTGSREGVGSVVESWLESCVRRLGSRVIFGILYCSIPVLVMLDSRGVSTTGGRPRLHCLRVGGGVDAGVGGVGVGVGGVGGGVAIAGELGAVIGVCAVCA